MKQSLFFWYAEKDDEDGKTKCKMDIFDDKFVKIT
jgi:hypothetical protein